MSTRLLSILTALIALGLLVPSGASAAIPPDDAPRAAVPTDGAPGKVAARGSCPEWTSAVAGYGKWVTAQGCSFTGAGYYYMQWQIPPYSNGRICVEGKGWTWNKTTKRNVAKWYSLGCGTGTYTPAKVPWCKGAPNPCLGRVTVRAKVQPGFAGAAYRFG